MFDRIIESINKIEQKLNNKNKHNDTSEELNQSKSRGRQNQNSSILNKRKCNSGLSVRQPLHQTKDVHKIFNGKKPWKKQQHDDPDLNEAIDKIEQLQKQIDQLDSENNLFKMDIKHLQKENEQM